MSDDNTDDTAIRLMAVGDIMLGVSAPHSIVDKDNVPSRLKEGNYSDIFSEEVTKAFKKADIVFGNLECVVSEDFNDYDPNSWIERPKLMMAPPVAIDFLKQNNFSILNIANNHMLDHGKKKAEETIEHIAKNEMLYIGDPSNQDNRVGQIEINNKKIGFFGYNLYVDEKKKVKNNIIKDIKNEKDNFDILVVSVHWGSEHIDRPSNEQMDFARKMVDLGVDIVLGHHSHVFQPVEIYEGKVIAYSLGNFIFDMWRPQHLHSGILDIEISQDNEIDVNIIPTKQNDYKVDSNQTDRKNIRVTNNISRVEDSKEYKNWAKKSTKKYYRELLNRYFLNFHKLPLNYHRYVISKWVPKMINKVMPNRN